MIVSSSFLVVMAFFRLSFPYSAHAVVEKSIPFIFPGPDDAFLNCSGDKEECFRESASQYIMTCSPEIKLQAQVDPEKINEPIMIDGTATTLAEYCGTDPENANCVFNPVSGSVTSLVPKSANTSLYRTTQSSGKVLKGRTESLEGFLAGDADPETIFDAGPSRKIQTVQQNCSQSIRYLLAVESLCREETQQGEFSPGFQTQSVIDQFLNQFSQQFQGCSLNEKIGDTSYAELLSAVRERAGGEGKEELYCRLPEYLDPDSAANNDLGKKQEYIDRASKIDSLRPILDRAFSKGYLAIANQKGTVYSVIPVLIPSSLGLYEQNFPVLSGSNNVGFNGPLRQLMSMYITQSQLMAMQDQQNLAQEKIAQTMRAIDNEQLDISASPYIDPNFCSNPSTDAQKIACLFADRINAGIANNEFEGPDGNTTCTFSPTKADAETAKKLYSSTKPNFLTTLFSFFSPPDESFSGTPVVSQPQVQNDSSIRSFLLVPCADFCLIRYTEKALFGAMADTNYASNIEQHIKEGNYKSNGFLRLSGIAPKITSYVSEKTFPSVSGSPVTISAEIVPTGDANPLMFGGWLAQLFYLYTAGVTADVDSPARAETYPTLETYWTSFKSESSQSTGTFEYCSDYKDPNDENAWITVDVPTIPEIKQLACSTAEKYNVPASMLWGIFQIESGYDNTNVSYINIASRLDPDVTTYACSLQTDGSFKPLNLMVNDCRVNLPEFFPDANPPLSALPANGESEFVRGRNVCEIEVAFDVIAQSLATYSKAKTFQYPAGSAKAGTPNWYWLAGQFGVGGIIQEFKQQEEPYKCAIPEGGPYEKWAHVSGCYENQQTLSGANVDYCTCLVENFPLDCSSL